MRQGRTKKTSGYMETEDMLEKILSNLRMLLESNFALSQFEFNYKSEMDRAVNDFKYKALLKRFYDCYRTCQTTVHLHSHTFTEREGDKDLKEQAIFYDPDLASVLKKFDYKRWRDNHIEHFFINPLHSAYLRMRANLVKLYTMGRDFWRYPLEENRTFIKNVVEMVTCENLAEKLLGTELKRDQLNFAYKTMEYLYLNRTKEMLLERSKGIIERVIPQLLIARTLDQMAIISERKYQDSKKPRSERPVIFKAHVNPAISRAIDIVSPPDPSAAQLTPEQEQEAYELNVYGRFNLWPDYMDEQHQKKMVEASEIMRTVNPAVRKDLEDYLIIQGISPDLEEFAASKKKSQAILSMAKELIEEDKEHEGKKIRPPNMWNHPETLNELERRFRPSSDPLESYKDNRVKRLIEEIHQLARHISSNTEDWKFLVENIVIFFETANKKMTDLKLKPVLDTEDPEINPDASP